MAPVDPGGGGGLPRNLPSAGDKFEVHRDALRDIAKKLQGDLDEHNGSGDGTLYDLESGEKGLVKDTVLGDYPAGEAISMTFSSAYDTIRNVYDQFLQSYEQVINAIKQTADNYQGAEDATQASANQVGANQQW